MKYLTHPLTIAILLAFNGGVVDTAGFLGLHGLFVAHVTGNFVTMGAAIIGGGHGFIGKLLALPEFVVIVALARLAGTAMRRRNWPAMPILFVIKILFLIVFAIMAIWHGPFSDGDAPIALWTGAAGVAAMAMQTAVQRVHLADMPPSTMMTGSTVQATLDAVDLLTRAHPEQKAATRARFNRLCCTIFAFACGCAISALLFSYVGFWCLLLAVFVAICTTDLQSSR
ncbi:DUF1275 domain-containing protein [[Pseudomonas] carboxydohydrogena]|uniref:DUF1275 domain-containing protein n=1 Tax=Afipia carboxydohydrogena TaxID=290 RepID=A0ABY8BLQ5_AFICR|nr:YoaK family protein [[Pseudomonas] carboxydohydrogena]WEF50878.1 DUF1275 domain-containing protein [[Pseudomonas] carboxydohydrogena]